MNQDRIRAGAMTVLLLALIAPPLLGETLPAGSELDAFERDVRPILVGHCTKCHGPDQQKGGLRLDTRAALVEGGSLGSVISVGHPEESLLIEAVRHEGDLKMPPKARLKPEQVAALERWIRAGAPWPATDPAPKDNRQEQWDRHWAFQPIKAVSAPPVREPQWCQTPVDAFIKAKLEAQGVAPAEPADRYTIIRRLTYNLTGLPPTPEEVDAFLQDQRPDAYAKLVDRLLASDRYGEHWARLWLDVARFADTKGYVYAREERFFVQAAPYRDWVVNAFNQDLPYNQFLLEQIAADQVDSTKNDSSRLAAMGFLTLGRRFLGVTPDIIDDRIDVLTRGTMGLTVACARCHDHKYDPIPTADYYSLYGVFQNGTEKIVRLVERSKDVQDQAALAFEKELKARQEKLKKEMESARAEASKRVRARIGRYLLAQLDPSKIPPEGFDVILGEDDLIPAFARRWMAYLERAAQRDDPVFRPWRQFAALGQKDFAARSLELIRQLEEPDAPALNRWVLEAFRSPPQSLDEVAQRYQTLFQEAEKRLALVPAPMGDVKRPSTPPLLDPDTLALGRVLQGDGAPCEIPDESIVSTEGFFDSTVVTRLWKLQGDVERWIATSEGAAPHAVALVDRAELVEPRIFKRGNSANPGDEVPRRFLLAVAGPNRPAFSKGSGRLEMAQAIVDPTNPLTARVWVNRIWAHHFGAGLVRTPSDFGIRSDPPSHPELLDWLASRLISEGWSTKAIHRLILLSSTYQQTSQEPEDVAQRELVQQVDPENRLLSRMNPHRLTFEETRDSWLATSGELEFREGGKSSPLFERTSSNRRRTLYGLIDRQFLPTALRVFDFANPDLHTPTRSETTVPQQALFVLNHRFLADRARAFSARGPNEDEPFVEHVFRSVYQRPPSASERVACLSFLKGARDDSAPKVPVEATAWHYGYGSVDPKRGPSGAFQPLPYFGDSGWTGGSTWPDPKLGWVQLTAEGGHPGNDLEHAAVRRWTASRAGVLNLRTRFRHAEAAGDGVRAWVVSSRRGVLCKEQIHNRDRELNVESIAVEAGDTIDFIVDRLEVLNSDQYHWDISLETQGSSPGSDSAPTRWNSKRDFVGTLDLFLSPREQLAQVLLMSNEFLFTD